MNRLLTIAFASLTLLVASAGLAQNAAQPAAPTGTHESHFRPPAPKLVEDSTAVVSTVYGTLEYSFTIQLSTPFVGAGSEVSCSVEVSVADSTGRDFTESASAPATISGKTAKCVVSVPYQWTLATPGTDKINASYGAELFTGETTGDSERGAGSNLGSISIPANGAITSTGIIMRL
jgi:hypothetical protein